VVGDAGAAGVVRLFSFAPPELERLRLSTHGLRRGLYSRAASRLRLQFDVTGGGQECPPHTVLLAFAGFEEFPIFIGQFPADGAEFAGALQPFTAVHHHDFAVDVAGGVAH
jgi:hypothetical protein